MQPLPIDFVDESTGEWRLYKVVRGNYLVLGAVRRQRGTADWHWKASWWPAGAGWMGSTATRRAAGEMLRDLYRLWVEAADADR